MSNRHADARQRHKRNAAKAVHKVGPRSCVGPLPLPPDVWPIHRPDVVAVNLYRTTGLQVVYRIVVVSRDGKRRHGWIGGAEYRMISLGALSFKRAVQDIADGLR